MLPIMILIQLDQGEQTCSDLTNAPVPRLAWPTFHAAAHIALPLPRLRSFNMADQELATLNAKIDKAEAYRDELRRGGEGGVVDRDMLFLAQKELVGLQEDKRRYIEKQGEPSLPITPMRCIVFRYPMHASNPQRGALTNSW